jgi:CRP-like cAMP-binding protein
MAVADNQGALSFFVARLRAHSPLDDSDRQALMALPQRELVLRAHQLLARSGEAAIHAWLVVDGLVGRIAQTDDGARQIQELVVAGELANLAAMMLPPRLCAFEAVSKSRVIAIPHAALRQLAAERPVIADAFARERLLTKEILAQWLLNIGRRDAKVRVIHFLCEFAVRSRVVSQGDSADFMLPMTQEQLGEALALTPVHINRTLKSLREDGLVEISRHQVRIRDWAALAAAGAFDPSYLRIDN